MTPAQLAERATLGTLLVDPRQLGTVAGWLRPSDFAHWWHTEVYRALLADPRLARRGDPAATAAARPGRPRRRRRAPPRRPTRPAHPDADSPRPAGRGPLRRDGAGGLDPPAGRGPCRAPAGRRRPGPCRVRMPRSTDDAVAGARSLRDVSGVVEPVLADLGAQWAAAVTATGQPAPREPVPGPGDVVAGGAFGGVVDVAADARRTDRQRDSAVVADRAVRSAPPSAPADARADTARLVAALVAHPDRVDAVAGWLRAGGGEPDRPAPCTRRCSPCTRSASRSTRSPSAGRSTAAPERAALGPDPAELLRQVEAAELLDVDALIRTVAHDTLRRTAASAADGMRAAAANPGLTVGDVLDAAAWAAQAVTRAAHDLGAARRHEHHPRRRRAPRPGTCDHRVGRASRPGAPVRPATGGAGPGTSARSTPSPDRRVIR